MRALGIRVMGVFSLGLLLFLNNCGKDYEYGNFSNLKIVNGKEIEEIEYPAVYYIGNCTASFISDNVLITAGHCASTGSTIRISRRISATSLKVIRHPKYNYVGKNDITIAIFPKGTSPYWVEIYDGKASVGDEAILVGYGRNSSSGGSGVKRMGRTKLTRVGNGVLNSYRTTWNPGSGEDVSIAPGDSGGPLFLNGKLAGIASYHQNYQGSGHADVRWPEAYDFIAQYLEIDPQDPPVNVIECPQNYSKYLASGIAYRDKFCKHNSERVYIAYAFDMWWKWLKTINSTTLKFISLDTQEEQIISAYDMWITK